MKQTNFTITVTMDGSKDKAVYKLPEGFDKKDNGVLVTFKGKTVQIKVVKRK